MGIINRLLVKFTKRRKLSFDNIETPGSLDKLPYQVLSDAGIDSDNPLFHNMALNYAIKAAIKQAYLQGKLDSYKLKLK